jgi:hypothetical protein
MWVVADLDEDYIAKMEDVLAAYEQPDNPQAFGERAGPLALMIAWSRSAMARSGCGNAAIAASTSLSPSAWLARPARRGSDFNS